jgi:hypothetical protein
MVQTTARKQISLIQEIKELCKQGRYDEAIAKTNEIELKEFAVRAHLLVMEHEQASKTNRKNESR